MADSEARTGFRAGYRVLVEFRIDQVKRIGDDELLELKTVHLDGAKGKPAYPLSLTCRPQIVHGHRSP